MLGLEPLDVLPSVSVVLQPVAAHELQCCERPALQFPASRPLVVVPEFVRFELLVAPILPRLLLFGHALLAIRLTWYVPPVTDVAIDDSDTNEELPCRWMTCWYSPPSWETCDPSWDRPTVPTSFNQHALGQLATQHRWIPQRSFYPHPTLGESLPTHLTWMPPLVLPCI